MVLTFPTISKIHNSHTCEYSYSTKQVMSLSSVSHYRHTTIDPRGIVEIQTLCIIYRANTSYIQAQNILCIILLEFEIRAVYCIYISSISKYTANRLLDFGLPSPCKLRILYEWSSVQRRLINLSFHLGQSTQN